MAARTFGWVQEAYTIGHLKNVVSVFIPDSAVNRTLREDKIPRLVSPDDGREEFLLELSMDPVEIPYEHLKGKGIPKGKTRATSPCSGIIQAVLPGQRKEYQSDWPADSYLRWAVSVGFLEYDREKDVCRISESGLAYGRSAAGSPEEEELLTQALLSNPPVCRILSLLDGSGPMTKFELGSRLGFIGEAGFTSIPQYMILEGLLEASAPEERAKLLQDTEGTSDKYVRTICSWLKTMGWVSQTKKEAVERIGGQTYRGEIGQAYMLTLKGRKVLKYVSGTSKFARVAKRVPWEMLATKSNGRVYLRNRRAFLLQYLAGGSRTVEEAAAFLEKQSVEVSVEAVLDDMEGFENIGLNLRRQGERYRIADEILGLEIPRAQEIPEPGQDSLEKIKDVLRPQLSHVDHKYLALLDLGADGSMDRLYEIQTAELLTAELGLKGRRLGDTRKPDVCVYWEKDGLIIDNKAYSRGYSLPMKQADEMYRYLEENRLRDKSLNANEWWKVFDESVEHFRFAFVSGAFTGGFKDRLENLARRSGLKGAAIDSRNLLLLAEQVKAGRMTYEEFFRQFDCLGQVAVGG